MLSPAQIQSLREYFEGLPAATRQRGKTYALGGRVVSLKELPRNKGYRSSIEGTELYETVLSEDRYGWSSECSCPVGLDCKHGAAMAYLLLESNLPTPKKSSSRTSDTAPPSKSEIGFFKKHLPKKSGGTLRNMAQALQMAWENYQLGERKLRSEILHAIFGYWPRAKNGPGETYRVFPQESLEPIQFWHFLLAFARENGVSDPPDFGISNDVTPTQSLIDSFRHAEEVRFWDSALSRSRPLSETRPPASLILRLKIEISTGGIIPQIFHGKKRQFAPLNQEHRRTLSNGQFGHQGASSAVGSLILRYIQMEGQTYLYPRIGGNINPALAQILLQIFQLNKQGAEVVGEDERPLPFLEEPLVWKWTGLSPNGSHLGLSLAPGPIGSTGLGGFVIHLPSQPSCCVTPNSIHLAPLPLPFKNPVKLPLSIPVESVLSESGLQSLQELDCPVPEEFASKIQRIQPRLHVRMRLTEDSGETVCLIDFRAIHEEKEVARTSDGRWEALTGTQTSDRLTIHDFKLLDDALRWIYQLPGWKPNAPQSLSCPVFKSFPADFVEWAGERPSHAILECDHELASLLRPPVLGEWKIDLSPSGVDWFDLNSSLSVDDTELTPEEIKLLLAANGGLVRIKGKGWKRLLVEAEDPAFSDLRDLGIDPVLEPGTRQRLHTLQLAGSRIAEASGAETASEIRERAKELQRFTAPKLPRAIQATLRPYQMDGFHFLARLSHCNLGGILADDMGLGKTLQALSWLAWLQSTRKKAAPVLVVCPKSVMDNWVAEAGRFYPRLTVAKASARSPGDLPRKMAQGGLIVANYTQLRLLETVLLERSWLAVILDEGQYIKNPDSKTAAVARNLQAEYRLILTGTPIENRLLDLWSQMQFAMPGALPPRASFQRQFNEKINTAARQNLSRRIRPFLLRRTKIQVAPDLPARIEEDILCELEGTQLSLYQAHLKEARRILLKIKSKQDLDKSRFNILTSLLRLRQACCHPSLVQKKSKDSEPSAKMEAMLDLVGPLMAEGQKVLIFSQFVEMLAILRGTLKKNGFPCYYLDGKTEDRSQIVNSFQKHKGAALFLISLKAGGSGLNLTAASYVILFDPWWNPAVEAQAIDRTHRIGQNQTVIAYRLIAKNTIEEKIRELQKQKTKLFQDVLGEENFGKALSLEDFRFLLADSTRQKTD